MKGWIVGAGLLALAGCASSTKLENDARIHSLRADAAARNRDYALASREQQEASRLHDKAVRKSYKEGRSDVLVPADVPAPGNPKGPDTYPP